MTNTQYGMKIALCFSGHLNDLNSTKEYWTGLMEKYDIDVYGSFWDEEHPELGDTIENFVRIYNPKQVEVESYRAFKESTQDIASLHITPPAEAGDFFAPITKRFGQLSMYYRIWRCNLLSKQLGIKYDLVMRARTDSMLDENFEITYNEMLNVPVGIVFAYAFPRSNGLNDCFAYAVPKIMDYYSFIFLQMMEYLNSGYYVLPAEHFLLRHFSKIRIPIRQFAHYITVTRTSKGLPDEVYNKTTYPFEDIIEWSDVWDLVLHTPESYGNFKSTTIKDDFVV